jgi:hypothetical protein
MINYQNYNNLITGFYYKLKDIICNSRNQNQMSLFFILITNLFWMNILTPIITH